MAQLEQIPGNEPSGLISATPAPQGGLPNSPPSPLPPLLSIFPYSPDSIASISSSTTLPPSRVDQRGELASTESVDPEMASGVPLCDPAFEGYLVNSFIDQRVRPYLTKQELFPLRKYWVGEKKGGIVDILLGDVPSDVAYPKPIGDGKARGIEIALCALSPGNKDYSLEDLAEVFGVSSVDPNNLGLAQYSGTIPFGVVREVYRRVAEKVISLATKKGFSTELQPLAVKVNKTVYVFTGRAQQQYLDEYGLGELTRECVNHVLEELGDPLELSDKKIVTKSMVFAVKPGRRIIGVNIKLKDMD